MDLAPELLKKIQTDFTKTVENKKELIEVLDKIKEGTADYKDAQKYAEGVGDILADCYKKHITKDILPDGRMSYELAEQIILPTMNKNHELVSFVSTQVQEELNKKIGVGLKAVQPRKNNDRIKGIIEKVSSYDDYDDAAWVLDEPITNYSQSVVDDFVRSNAKFQHESGLETYVERTVAGNCCEWCSSLAGVYEYPNVPKEVYQRHRFCRCLVTYHPEKGKAQNVHTKVWL